MKKWGLFSLVVFATGIGAWIAFLSYLGKSQATEEPKPAGQHGSDRRENEKPQTLGSSINAIPPEIKQDNADAVRRQILEEELENLRAGNLAYNAPEKMKTGQTFRIVARIGSDKVSIQTLQSGIPKGPNIKTDTLATPVTTKMKMTLKGADFDITPLSSEEQFVAGESPTTWEWDIAPKHSGTLGLHLAAVVELNGMSKDYQAVDRNIAVEVDPIGESEKFARENWHWILTTLGAGALAAWGWFKRKREPKPTELLP